MFHVKQLSIQNNKKQRKKTTVKAYRLPIPPLFIEGQREMSVACDDKNFSSPKSSQGGSCLSLDFSPFGRRPKGSAGERCFQTKCGERTNVELKDYALRL